MIGPYYRDGASLTASRMAGKSRLRRKSVLLLKPRRDVSSTSSRRRDRRGIFVIYCLVLIFRRSHCIMAMENGTGIGEDSFLMIISTCVTSQTFVIL